jgi:hypothetical protein
MTPACTSADVHAVSGLVHRNEYATQTLPGPADCVTVWLFLPTRQFNADTSLLQKPAKDKRSSATEHLGVTDMKSVKVDSQSASATIEGKQILKMLSAA